MSNKTFCILKIKAPYNYNELELFNYICVPCSIENSFINDDTKTMYVVSINTECYNTKQIIANNGNILVDKIYTSFYECKKEVSCLNDKIIRDIIKQSSIIIAKDISKVLRANLAYIENLHNSILNNIEISKG